ncbi:MAG: hypothetical protein RIS70_357 [Planctomycetota bacterium]|jgi:hypothetical protein
MDEPLRDQLYACRHDSNDLNSPDFALLKAGCMRDRELATTLERVHAWDRLLAEQLPEVPVPEGLAGRLLSTCEASRMATASQRSQPQPYSGQRPPDRILRQTLRRYRFATIAIAGSLVAAVCLIAFMTVSNHNGSVTVAELRDQAMDWRQRLSMQWEDFRTARIDYPIPERIRIHPQGFQRIETEWDARTHAFSLDNDAHAILFALRSRRSFDMQGTVTLMQGKGGWNMAAWREGSEIYVLMIESRHTPDFDRYLRTKELAARIRAATRPPA